MKTESNTQAGERAFSAPETLAAIAILAILVTGAFAGVHFIRESAATQVRDFHYSLDLVNTTNLASNTLDQNADSVRFGAIHSETTMTLGGVEYKLVLEFGETTANGFSTINEFFVHEDRKATGRLFGTLIPVPTVDDESDRDLLGGLLHAINQAAVNAAGGVNTGIAAN